MTVLEKIAVPTLTDIAFDKLVEAITSGEFKPGQRLSEAKLARQFGISRGPLREALGRLEGRMVMRRPHLGVSVMEFSSDAIAQSFAVREALEGMAARLAAQNMPDDEIVALRKVLQTQKTESEAGGMGAAPAQIFHLMVIRGSRNTRLIEILVDQLRLQMSIHRSRSREGDPRSVDAWSEHVEIVDALAGRDAEAAEAAMRKHLRCYAKSFLAQHARVTAKGGPAA